MDVHLVDGTYELFRHFFALPRHVNKHSEEVAATRGVLGFLLGLLESGVTHLGVATDHVIESFRNELWPGYKSSAGVDPVLLAQFPLLEEAITALGIVNWPMTELEADDAMAAVAAFAAGVTEVDRVLIGSPDKDLAQCIIDGRVVQLADRRSGQVRDEAATVERFGVPPSLVTDYLALVGDSADGYPGLQGFGSKSAAALLSAFGHLEQIPADSSLWPPAVRGASRLCLTLEKDRDLAFLFRDLATLRTHDPVLESIEELRWLGPASDFLATTERLESPQLLSRALALARREQ